MVDEYPPQIFVHPERPVPEKFDPVENSNRSGFKPKGGLWTSSLQDKTFGWIDWMESEQWSVHDPEEMQVWRLDPKDELDLYVIESKTDAQALLEVYEQTEDPFSGMRMEFVDYEAVAEDYDGIWMKEEGLRAIRFDVPVFYGWDCESTLHFSYNFKGPGEPIDIDINL